MAKVTPKEWKEGLRASTNRYYFDLLKIKDIRFCNNNEDIEWKGDTYHHFPLSIRLPKKDGKLTGDAEIIVSTVDDALLTEVRKAIGKREETRMEIGAISLIKNKLPSPVLPDPYTFYADFIEQEYMESTTPEEPPENKYSDIRQEVAWQSFKLKSMTSDNANTMVLTCSMAPDFNLDQYPQWIMSNASAH